jgi:DNA-binding protein
MKNLEDLLNNTDFSQDSKKKEAIKAMLLTMLKREEKENHAQGGIFMKKNRARPYVVAVAAAFTVCVLIAACGEDIAKAVQQFTIGRYAVYFAPDAEQVKQIEAESGMSRSVGFRMALFSYDAEIESEKGKVAYFDTIDDVKPYLAFNPLIPVSLPTDFALDRISLFCEENGRPLPLGSNMYLNVYYTNAEKTQQIYMQIRLMNEETAYSSGSKDMRYIFINGQKGVVADKNVNVEIGGVMYMIMADMAESVTQDDVIKMAESLR